jgi:D-alanine-D-alanine ligase
VKSKQDLKKAVEEAFLYDTKILIEKAVNAREIELAVLENSHYGEEAEVSVPGEVIPHHEFYSYDAKYMDPNGASLVVPAKLTPEQTAKAQQIARTLFAALGIEGMARVDLFLDKDSGEFYFNEVNTIPGFTQVSLYPKLWEASGLAYQTLLTRLIELALARQVRRKNLKREKAA